MRVTAEERALLADLALLGYFAFGAVWWAVGEYWQLPVVSFIGRLMMSVASLVAVYRLGRLLWHRPARHGGTKRGEQ